MKKKPLLKVTAFFLLTFIFSIHSACTLAEDSASKKDYGDAFVNSSPSDARTLVPILASDSASASVAGMIFNGLVKYDDELNLTGDLARSWDISDDGLVITFHLRDGVTWHDGTPFTSEDVKFTYERLIDPMVPTPYSGDFKMVKELSVPDKYTVRVTYNEPFAPGLASWGMPVIPKHILEGQDLTKTPFARYPVGTGPYKFSSWKAMERIDLGSFHDYFEHRPYIDRVIFRVIPDPETAFLEMQAGNVDYLKLTPLQFDRLTDTASFKRNFRKFKFVAFSYTFMAYNLNNELFKDKRVRKAIDYAVDKQEIIDGLLLGHGRIATGPFLPESWAYNSDVSPVPYDPTKAKELLAEAGWGDTDHDGWLDKNGRKFEFTVLTNQGNALRAGAAQIIQRRLADIGINMNIRVLEWSVFINEFVNKRRFEAVMLGWSLSRDPDCYSIWHSSQSREGEFNFGGYSNNEVDALIEEGRRTFDQSKRKKAYNRMHRIIHDDEPYLFLYIPDELIAVSRRFEGIKETPYGITSNFIDWYAPVARQRYRR